jgi:hypothetical protein
MTGTRRISSWAGIALINAFLMTMPFLASAQETQSGAAAARKVGTVKSITGNILVVKPDSGADINVTVADSTRIVRLAPGQTDLKSAMPMSLNEVQVGDRMLVRGAPGSAPDSIAAATIVVMKASDVSQKQQQQLQDWQRRGAGGIVTAVDTASGSITIASTPTVSYVVNTSPGTGYLRYAPDSIKFSDAVKGTFDQIKTGDQLRARGNRSPDGKEIAAEEVISGTFRNIAGTVSAIDAANSTVTVKDILAKKTVAVKLTPESQMRKLPPQLAQRIAFVLKGPATGQGGVGTPASANAAGPGGGQAPAAAGQGGGPGQRPGGSPDFQQMISRLPAVTLADLQKDDAVMIVSTAGTGGNEVTAITLLSGVEPILTASPNVAAALLSGWNLSAPGGGEGP